jgi:hypothetical protein
MFGELSRYFGAAREGRVYPILVTDTFLVKYQAALINIFGALPLLMEQQDSPRVVSIH